MSLASREHLIDESENFIRWMDRQIDNLEVRADLRSRLASGCFDMALEHQKAIILLIARQLYGSAFALIRVIFEAYVRGLWLHRCATDRDLDNFSNDRVEGTFDELLKKVENVEEFETRALSKLKGQYWKAMNSYTHTGIMQISRRHTEDTIQANYDDGEILDVISFANFMAFLAAFAICDVAGNVELANVIYGKMKQIFQDLPET